MMLSALSMISIWNGLQQMDFVGLNNYLRLFNDRTFWTAFSNNLILMIATVTIQAG
jgi:ABC-type sugar transport system permease subunit